MTLTELRYIVALARERHFGRAAEACFVSQPTLSVAVRKLEEELGVSIFERNANDLTVTPIGARIVAQAQRALQESAAVKEIAKSGQDQLSGPLRIGAIYTIGPYLLPALIPLLHRRAPAMPLIIEENFTAVLAEKLKHGELDVIVISLPFEQAGIVTLPLYREPFVVVLPSAHPLTQREALRPGDLSQQNLLLLGAGHCFRDQVIDACPDCLARPEDTRELQRVEGGSLETIRHMVASGMGITVLPCTAAGVDRYARRLLVIRRFLGKAPFRDVALAWRESFPRAQVIEVLRAAVAECNLTCTDAVPASARKAARSPRGTRR
ncbi:MAG: hydrogen peroxide-inducible genes activator [Gammaproteobacteria bacterium]